jgi:hypothetical protein
MTEDMLAISIPIVGIIAGCAIPIVYSLLDYRKRRELIQNSHRERMAAIERGIELPPLPDALLRGSGPRSSNPLLRGLVWTLAGGALAIALKSTISDDAASWGFIPVGVGLAYLIYYAIEGRKLAKDHLPARTPDGRPNPPA